MIILEGIKNFLVLVNDNWMLILCICGLAIALARKIKAYLSTSTEEKIKIAKTQISEAILKMITDAEEDYSEWVSAGAIKRSQVIEEIFAEYPILEKVVDQQALIQWIDEQIDSALDVLRDIIAKQDQAQS